MDPVSKQIKQQQQKVACVLEFGNHQVTSKEGKEQEP